MEADRPGSNLSLALYKPCDLGYVTEPWVFMLGMEVMPPLHGLL